MHSADYQVVFGCVECSLLRSVWMLKPQLTSLSSSAYWCAGCLNMGVVYSFWKQLDLMKIQLWSKHLPAVFVETEPDVSSFPNPDQENEIHTLANCRNVKFTLLTWHYICSGDCVVILSDILAEKLNSWLFYRADIMSSAESLSLFLTLGRVDKYNLHFMSTLELFWSF